MLPIVLIAVVGCSGFYTDAPTPTPGPASTATPEGRAAPEIDFLEVVAEQARVALGERLGTEGAVGLVDEITGQPFTNLRPGCMPGPAGYDGPYIIPGLVVSIFHEDVRYEFHSDENATTGGLCQSVTQLLAFTDLAELGDIPRPELFLDRVVTAGTLAEGQALMDEFRGDFSLRLDDIDWDGEDLVGTSVSGTGCSFSASVNSVDWDIDGGVINLRIETISTGDCESVHLRPVFILVEDLPSGLPFAVIAGGEREIGAPSLPVAVGSSKKDEEEQSEGASAERAPLFTIGTPNPIFEALDTAVAGGR